MAKKQQEIHEVDSIPWTPIDGTPGGYEKILNIDPETGSVTRLLRLEPGTETKHVLRHEFYEELFVVDGSSVDLSKNIKIESGYYGYRHPGMEHGPWRTEEGQITFEVHEHKK